MQPQLPLTSREIGNPEIISLKTAQTILAALTLITAFFALVVSATY